MAALWSDFKIISNVSKFQSRLVTPYKGSLNCCELENASSSRFRPYSCHLPASPSGPGGPANPENCLIFPYTGLLIAMRRSSQHRETEPFTPSEKKYVCIETVVIPCCISIYNRKSVNSRKEQHNTLVGSRASFNRQYSFYKRLQPFKTSPVFRLPSKTKIQFKCSKAQNCTRKPMAILNEYELTTSAQKSECQEPIKNTAHTYLSLTSAKPQFRNKMRVFKPPLSPGNCFHLDNAVSNVSLPKKMYKANLKTPLSLRASRRNLHSTNTRLSSNSTSKDPSKESCGLNNKRKLLTPPTVGTTCTTLRGYHGDRIATYSTPHISIPPEEFYSVETARQPNFRGTLGDATLKFSKKEITFKSKHSYKSKLAPVKAVSKKISFNKTSPANVGICPKFQLPGCRKPTTTTCITSSETLPSTCSKVFAPSPSYSECIKSMSPSSPDTECDLFFKLRQLQPQCKMLKGTQKFIVPKPEVDVYIDTSLGECCENGAKPTPLSCVPLYTPDPPISTMIKLEEKSPEEFTFFTFFRSLLSAFTGKNDDLQTCRSTKDSVRETESSPSKPIPAALSTSTTGPTMVKLEQTTTSLGPEQKSNRQSAKVNEKCMKLKLPGCRTPTSTVCNAKPFLRPPCSKKLAPSPSFSECLKKPCFIIPYSECHIARKRVKSLMDIRAKGLRCTPETIHEQFTNCLKPKTTGCELAISKEKCRKISHDCKQVKRSRGKFSGTANSNGNDCSSTKVVKKADPKEEPKKTNKKKRPLHVMQPYGQLSCKAKKDNKLLGKNITTARCFKPAAKPSNSTHQNTPTNPPCDIVEKKCEWEPYRIPKEES